MFIATTISSKPLSFPHKNASPPTYTTFLKFLQPIHLCMHAFIHAPPPPRLYFPQTSHPAALVLLILLLLRTSIAATTVDIAAVLVAFKESLENSSALDNWNASISAPCSSGEKGRPWAGVVCFNGLVWSLKLEGMGLSGKIDVESLGELPFLRSLSLINNEFTGPMPEVRKLPALKSLYLSGNMFSDAIGEEAFVGMKYLKRVYLADNAFTGEIPRSLMELPRLMDLRLENNQFGGEIPSLFSGLNLYHFNVSNNHLEGPIPLPFTNFGTSSFSGNDGLCGPPLMPCLDAPPKSPPFPSDPVPAASPPTPEEHKPHYIIPIIVWLSIIALIISIISCCFSLKRLRSSRRGAASGIHGAPSKFNMGKVERYRVDNMKSLKKAEQGRLVFVKEDAKRFDLHNMLRASAEVLGSGDFGASYKTALSHDQVIVVKRFKLMNNIGRDEFEEHMGRSGRLRHDNLLPLVAYFYRREEKLLVRDFVDNGSLASHLHGNHSVDRPALDWATRLRIIKGTVKGLAYLYKELPSMVVPHGHLKASNILLTSSFAPVLTDYTLVPLVDREGAERLMVAYKSPEYAKVGRLYRKTDVWSLGILVLEVVTGKLPAGYLAQGAKGREELVEWVESARKGGFDVEMGGTENAGGQVQRMVDIGVACCNEDVEKRWDIGVAFEEIQRVRVVDGGREWDSQR